jgi:hypothetical protein
MLLCSHGTARHGVMLLCSAFGFLGGSRRRPRSMEL